MAEQQIIIKKSDEHDDDHHHGGGWKVAYADFMTAMMAFFLILWIISTADKPKLQGLAQYFTPSQTSELRGGEGFLDGQVFGPDGVFSGVDGREFQIQPPSFGREDPVSPPDDRQPDAEPRVVVEYEPAPQRQDGHQIGEDDDAQRDAPPAIDLAVLAAYTARADRLNAVVDEIAAAVAQNPALVERAANLRIERTADGLLVQIVDQEERPMFASGSAQIGAAMQELVGIIGLAVSDLPYPLSITGHTDAVPFTTRPDYGNWELSADRANATRRALINAGVPDGRIARVSGLADTMPLNAAAPTAPENRRITLLLAYPEPEEASGG